MKKLSGIIILSLFFVLAILALLPWLNGLYFKQHYLNLLNNINAHAGNQNIQVLEYHVGWLSSQAKIEVKTNKFTFIDEEIISHGPFQAGFAMAVIHDSLIVEDTFLTALLGKQPNSVLLKVNSFMYYNGDVYGDVEMPALNVVLPANLGSISWQGLKGTFYSNIQNDYYKEKEAQVTVGAINADLVNPKTNTRARFTTQAVTVKAKGTFAPVGLWVGDSEVSVPSIMSYENDQLINSLTNLHATSNINLRNNQLYNILYKISIAGLQAQKYNKLGTASVNLTFAANDFNAQALVDFANFSKSRSQAILLDDATKMQMIFLLTKAITTTSSIVADLSAKTALGDLLVNGKAAWPANPTPSPSVKINIKIAIPLANELANIVFANRTPPPQDASITDVQPSVVPPVEPPASPVQVSTPPADPGLAVINAWLSQGYLIQNQNDYTAEITYENGVTTINGKLLSPPQSTSPQATIPTSTPELTPSQPQ